MKVDTSWSVENATCSNMLVVSEKKSTYIAYCNGMILYISETGKAILRSVFPPPHKNKDEVNMNIEVLHQGKKVG